MAQQNGAPGNAHPQGRLDPHFTQNVIDAMGPATAPRTRQVLSSLIRHLHDFARDVELTHEEWLASTHFVNAVGQISSQTRNESHRISDVLGLESCVSNACPPRNSGKLTTRVTHRLIDDMANKIVAEGGLEPTSTSILGPFWSPNAPFRDNGSSIIQDPAPGGRVCKMHGVISDSVSGHPIPGAVVDIWQASSNGQYDFQDPEHQSENNLRGKFTADAEGRYWFYCYHPTAYSLPTDGPSYQLLQMMDRHPMRPAHIHIMVSLASAGAPARPPPRHCLTLALPQVTHPEYRACTTQLYPRDDPWLATDAVFGVKDDLVVEFEPLEGDDKAELALEYNVALPPEGYKGKQFN